MKETSSLIILGMHRSGTSLLTGLLSQVGVKMGRSLYEAQKGVNEKGFWEHEDIVDTHDELLLALNSQWDDLLPLQEGWAESGAAQPFVARLENLVKRDFSDACVWALKDPRMCRLLPLWMPIFQRLHVKPVFICMNRNPFEVGASLQKRDGFSREKALVLWLSHSLQAERYSRGQSRIFIDFDQVVQDPVEILSEIEHAANLAFPVAIGAAAEKIKGFVSPALRHHKADAAEESKRDPLSSMAYRLYRILRETSTDCDFHERIDAVASEFAAYRKNWNIELLEQIHYLNQERADYRIKFFRIYKSWSWLLVKPFWLIEKVLRKY